MFLILLTEERREADGAGARAIVWGRAEHVDTLFISKILNSSVRGRVNILFCHIFNGHIMLTQTAVRCSFLGKVEFFDSICQCWWSVRTDGPFSKMLKICPQMKSKPAYVRKWMCCCGVCFWSIHCRCWSERMDMCSHCVNMALVVNVNVTWYETQIVRSNFNDGPTYSIFFYISSPIQAAHAQNTDKGRGRECACVCK